ncbi:MAG: hypothetical protein JWL90_4153 [Chthoniobacteraceae bacterium]|nr:hypothetical protein [Chthoniobacteraceae bacterium]
MSRKPRKPLRKLKLGVVATAWETRAIPTRWLNSVIGLFLLPPAGLLTQTLFTSFSRAAVEHGFWAAEEFWFFSLGAILWTLAFFGSIWVFGEPRPLRVYVFGHELTHAIWVWAMGGRVSQFEVGRDGGFILTDTHNVWIALAPYFYPLYSIVVIALYGVASLFYDVTLYTPGLFALIGLTWAFHMSFTIWMIPKGQSDLTQFGTFYSLVIIYIMNLLLLGALLIFAAPEVTFHAFGREWLENTENFAAFLWPYLRQLVPIE